MILLSFLLLFYVQLHFTRASLRPKYSVAGTHTHHAPCVAGVVVKQVCGGFLSGFEGLPAYSALRRDGVGAGTFWSAEEGC